MRNEQLPAGAAVVGLDRLGAQVHARVWDLAPVADGDTAAQDLVLRLMEIGFLPGEPVHIMARGFPQGDPLAVRIGQATFALRRHEAALVLVCAEPSV